LAAQRETLEAWKLVRIDARRDATPIEQCWQSQ
jgi:hypothetical protein